MSNRKRSRAEQARINGAKSKGPKTAEGRLRIAQANTTHGLYAINASVLNIEPLEAFQFYRDAAVRRFKPRDPLELQYVEEFADISWRIARLRQSATEAVNKEIYHIRTNATRPMARPAIIAEAEIAGSQKSGAQTVLQARISALIRDRQAVLRELRAIQQADFLEITQMSLKTLGPPPEITQGEPKITEPEPNQTRLQEMPQ